MGRGLSLAVCKGFLQAMGDRLWLEETPGEGRPRLLAARGRGAVVSERRILVVDDETQICRALDWALTALHVETDHQSPPPPPDSS